MLSAVDGTNISNVIFTISNGDTIETSFSHVHSEYALVEVVNNILTSINVPIHEIVYGTGDDITSNDEFVYYGPNYCRQGHPFHSLFADKCFSYDNCGKPCHNHTDTHSHVGKTLILGDKRA